MFAFLCKRTWAKARDTTFMMSHQIVMIRSAGTSPVATISMFAFSMSGSTKAFGNNAPLDRQILATIYRTTFIHRPTDGTMVHNHVFILHSSQSVRFSAGFITYTETKITKNDVVRFNRDRIFGNTDTLSWRCLSCNRQITVGNGKIPIQKDGTGHIKNNRTCSALRNSMPQSSGLCSICKSSHMIYFSTTATGGIPSETFGTGESTKFSRWLGFWFRLFHRSTRFYGTVKKLIGLGASPTY